MFAKRVIAVCGSVALIIGSIVCSCAREDPGWPREFKIGENRLIVHQPQVDRWENYAKLEASLVLEITPAGAEKPTLGAVWLSADTTVDMDTRLVSFQNVRITRTSFPSLDGSRSEQITRLLDKILPRTWPDVSLDRIVANLKRTEQSERTLEGSTEPPTILTSEKPAILIQFDGKPVLSPIGDSGLKFAVNTNWDLFFDRNEDAYYLLDGDSWLTTPDIVKGPWKVATRLPKSFAAIPDDENWKDVRAHLTVVRDKTVEIPEVFVSMRPAELIVLDGKPKLQLIEGTQLSYVTNTDSPLFFFQGDGRYYYLVSGRWFRSKSLEGPWNWVGNDLPKDFAEISPDGPRGDVLSSVPGTREADEARIQAQIPRRAVVKRNEARLTVYYNGEPKFAPIKGTSLHYAVNTSTVVIRVGNRYYACEDGIWFLSDSPKGPWQLADSVPDSIYTIPPSSPVYNSTYVQVYNASDDYVEYGYTAGYLGCYEAYGTVVYGTGYYYPPYVWLGPRPIFWPRPYSYGFAAHYNPVTGNFVRAGVLYGPYRGIGRGAVYNPRTGTYARGVAAWGPQGAAWAGFVYSPSTGFHWASGSVHRGSASPYARWGNAIVAAGTAGVLGTGFARRGVFNRARQDTIRARRSDGRTMAQDRLSRIRESGMGRQAQERISAIEDSRRVGAGRERGEQTGKPTTGKGMDDLYVGKDGNIYKRTGDSWSRYGKDSQWMHVSPSQEGVHPSQRAQPYAKARVPQRDALEAAKKRQLELKERDAQRRQRLQEQESRREGLERAQMRAGQQRLRQRQSQPRSPEQLSDQQRRFQRERMATQQGRRSAQGIINELNRDAAARARGQQRAHQYAAYQRSSRSVGARGSYGGRRGGGFHGGGRRR